MRSSVVVSDASVAVDCPWVSDGDGERLTSARTSRTATKTAPVVMIKGLLRTSDIGLPGVEVPDGPRGPALAGPL